MKRSTVLFILPLMIISALAVYGVWSYFSSTTMCNGDLNIPLCMSDRATQEKTLTYCNQTPDEKAQEACLLRAIPAVVKDSSACAVIALERGRALCEDYSKRLTLARNKQLPATYRFFDYEQKKVELTFVDGTKKELMAFVADTDDKQIQGLSLRKDLKDNEAMLFIHKTPKKASYYMKDMLFSLDISYFNTDGKIVNSYRSLPSCVVYTGECAVYTSTNSDVKYTLEYLPQGKDVMMMEIK